ncbi:MAG: 6-carboxytetrahydropterin synthase [Betaproteobacteria bacterium]|nr:6-carboxytetrahydropterin synthase [Betaproteobacteria bacterium]NBT09461.1 6-carboxytetrahydropterin synthase [Betaproteobacteria bacterium]NBU50491.1 6-carboxytetrahydropterin synthase [Betaproteobacteria bacterium]
MTAGRQGTIRPVSNASYELSQRFHFEAAHTLRRAEATGEVESSRRVHGHTYLADITLRGQPDERGMVMDLGLVRAEIAQLRQRLDHRFLDEIDGLGPATLENLCAFIARHLRDRLPQLVRVRVWRDASGDSCVLHLE